MAAAVSAQSIQGGSLGVGRIMAATVTLSGNYPTGGEPITAAMFGLTSIDVLFPTGGVAMASDRASGIGISWDAANSKLVCYEGSAAGTALTEKTSAEAYPTGCFIGVTVIGR